MGWLADAIFGKPESQDDGALPKRVEQWNNGDRTIAVPVPDERDEQSDPQADGASQKPQDPTRDAAGQKIVPEVRVERLDVKPLGSVNKVEVWATLKNHSELEVDVTKVLFLSGSVDPNRFLRPSEMHEIKIYSGDTPRNEAYKKLEVQYKIRANGDYFQADHLVQYEVEQYEGVTYYMPVDIDPLSPIRDIYG